MGKRKQTYHRVQLKSVLVAYARAAYKLSKEGQSGCKTVFDIAPAYLSAKSGDELRASLL